MLHTHFKLQRRPFPSVPAPSYYFAAESIEDARQSLVRLVDRQEGPGLVIGSVGVGKSLLCALLGETFRPTYRVVKLPSGRLSSRRSFLQAILYELGQPYRDLEEGELRLSLMDYVKQIEQCPSGVLLLVDEAENLGLALLDELRSLTNIAHDGAPCFHVVLFGSPRLEEKFAHPRLESFNQRLAGRFYLEPFRHDETEAYVRAQFERSGGRFQDLFAKNACRAIHQATGGIPRLINQLTDHALVLVAANRQRKIDAFCIEEAWADLQQLPAPYVPSDDAAGPDLPSDIIEFGELDAHEEDDMLGPQDAGERAEFALDSIEENIKLATVSNDWEATGNVDQELQERQSITSNEVSLIFHPAHDPFGNDFAEEEIVVDEFISANSLSQRHRRQVLTPVSAELAGCLNDAKVSLSSEAGPTTSAPTRSSEALAPSFRVFSDNEAGGGFDDDSADFEEFGSAEVTAADEHQVASSENTDTEESYDNEAGPWDTEAADVTTEIDAIPVETGLSVETVDDASSAAETDSLETEHAGWLDEFESREEGFVQEIIPGWEQPMENNFSWDAIDETSDACETAEDSIAPANVDEQETPDQEVAADEAASTPAAQPSDAQADAAPRPDYRRLFSQLRANRR